MSWRLLGYAARATSWVPPVLAGALAIGFGVLASKRDPNLASRLLLTRAALLCVGIGASFVFDDRARDIRDPLPAPLRHRRSIQLLPTALVSAAAVVVALASASSGMRATWTMTRSVGDITFPALRIGLEGMAMVAFPLALAAVVGKRFDPSPGKYAAAALVVFWMVTWLVPERLRPWDVPGPGGPMTSAWALAAFSAAAGAALAVANWDSMQRPLIRRRRSA